MMEAAAIQYQDDLEKTRPTPEELETPTNVELEYDDDEPNLVPVFMDSEKGRDALKLFVEHAIGEFDQAVSDSKDYVDIWMRNWRLLAGHLPNKTGAFKDTANANVPLSLEHVSRVAFRVYSEIFPDNKDFFSAVASKKDDQEAADLTTHGNWQFRNDIPNFDRQMHRAVLAFIHIGDWICHSYYDPVRKRNRHEILMPDEFVMPWAHATTEHDLSDLPWYARVCYYQKHEIEGRKERWHGVDDLLNWHSSSSDDEPIEEAAEAINREQGQEKPSSTKYAPWKVIWWEGWVNLPGQTEDRFVQAHIHYETKKCLSLHIQEEADWKDRAEYQRKLDQRSAYQAQVQQVQQMRSQEEQRLGIADEYLDTMVDEEMAAPEDALEGMQMVEQERERVRGQFPDPPMPDWMEGNAEAFPKRPPARPVLLFTHAVCLEPLVGNRGLSYGRIQADLQRAVNTLLSQFIDQATFSNVGCFVGTGKLNFTGQLKIKPGYINKAENLDIDDIRKHLMPLTLPQANQQLFDVANMLMEKARSSMQASEILSGEPGKSGETWKGVAARIEQATKQLSVIGRKMLGPLRQVVLNNAYLNSIFLKDEEFMEVVNSGVRKNIRVSRLMYRRSYDIEFSTDMRFTTNVQRIAEADDFTNQVMGLSAQPGMPLFGNLAIQYEAVKRSLVARGHEDVVPLLGEPPAPPQQFGQPSPGFGQQPPGAPPGGPPGGGAPPPGGGGPPA